MSRSRQTVGAAKTNGKEDRLDVVVLKQLLFEHLCEVVRVLELAQRLSHARDDKLRVISDWFVDNTWYPRAQ